LLKQSNTFSQIPLIYYVLSAIPYEEIPFKRIMAFQRFYQQLTSDEKSLDDGNFDEAEILKFIEQ
jgi:hypothetical protein